MAQAAIQRADLDRQQALLVRVLARRPGEPVSYEALRDAGVEYPASVVSELELAGLPVERCYEGSLSARRLLGVRLYAAPAAGAGELPRGPEEGAAKPLVGEVGNAIASVRNAAATRALGKPARDARAWLSAGASVRIRVGEALKSFWTAVWVPPERKPRPVETPAATARAAHRAAQENRPAPPAPRAPRTAVTYPPRRWLAPTALLIVASTLAALTAAELRGAGHESGARAYGTLQPSRSPSGGQAAAPVPGRATIPASPATAAQLEARGHELLTLGQREAAVGVLERAVAATGENLDGCREPVSETCLTYAYALYDLGRALLLDHQPQAAVMILEHRLQIANQRPAVQSELDLARQEAGLQTRPQ